jgi:hypothetical protein
MLIYWQNSYANHSQQCSGHHEAQSHGTSQQNNNPPCNYWKNNFQILFVLVTSLLKADPENLIFEWPFIFFPFSISIFYF